uniref:Uncharacterized protein n=1 Tax=Anguilla anguilla TaxID=7936 RepID=A0A0E9R1E2_ANGAN
MHLYVQMGVCLCVFVGVCMCTYICTFIVRKERLFGIPSWPWGKPVNMSDEETGLRLRSIRCLTYVSISALRVCLL